jgi:tRNA (uracil-5-)-methyltransferase TRM9
VDKAAIQRLNAINRAFYQTTADEFDQTRGSAWAGWDGVLKTLTPAPSPSGRGEKDTTHLAVNTYPATYQKRSEGRVISVLDVGCGNGRFGVFLRDHLGEQVQYHGVDNNETLLNHAREALGGMNARLETRDIVEQPPDSGEYDLVVLFGVIHHIPGTVERQQLMRQLAARVKAGGLLVFACWRFYEYARFRERIAAWPEDVQAEAGDYLLDWRRGAVSLRYCHYVDDAEHAALIAATGMSEVVRYRADGQDGQANQYSILRKS